MKRDRSQEKSKLREKVEHKFLEVVRKGLDDETANDRIKEVRQKYPGLTNDALADILIKRAARKTLVSGAASGATVTGSEAVTVLPIPEVSHKVAAVSGIGAAIVADLAYSTRIQMRLLQEIGHVYDCPFDENDEEDVWLIFRAAQGVKGVGKIGDYASFVAAEAASKQFRKLLRTGVRRAVQDKVIKVAGTRAGKLIAEKALMRLVPLVNIAVAAKFNHFLTKRAGHWGKIRARIRSGMFQHLETLRKIDPDAAKLTLPIIFHVGTAADTLTDNTLTLYSQTAKRLCLSDEEVAAMEHLNEDCRLEDLLRATVERLGSLKLGECLMHVGVITAAASRLKFLEEHHESLVKLSEILKVGYHKQDLKDKIKALKG